MCEERRGLVCCKEVIRGKNELSNSGCNLLVSGTLPTCLCSFTLAHFLLKYSRFSSADSLIRVYIIRVL